ncbi:MAG TPA: penicillin acylase family protein [Pyrinomonadaceae bacterium]|nr:penicillin acylase family protein [Pyrinomonadaceae bacterium]
MKISLRKVLLLILAAGICVVPNSLFHFPRTAAQQPANTVTIPGLHGRVTIRRDERGIPFIEATNDDDLFFAQGYVTASDRLWQMDVQRRAARGELAEIFGQAALAQDKQHRTFGFAKVVDETAAHLPPDLTAILNAYAKGVNAYIDSRTNQNLPPEFLILQYKPRPWTPADSLAIGKLMAEYLSTSWQIDIMRAAMASLPKDKREALLPEVSPLDVLVVGKDRNAAKTSSRASLSPARRPNADVLATVADMIENERRSAGLLGVLDQLPRIQASNNWVVSGKRTVSGKPLLANDPHIPASAPSVWYLTELSAPGMHVAGATFPGAPGIIVGHNDRIAWGVTNLGPDVQDLYIEKFDKDNARRYLTPDGWRDAEIRQEVIKVRKGFGDATTDTRTLDVTVTRHGPIILEKNSERYALRWTALDASLNEAGAFLQANRARNWKEFTAALSTYGGPTQNFVYADVDGHIGYYGAGKIPIRKSGDGSVPYDGSTDAGEWTGWIPFDRLPHVFDPPAGIIVTANQRVIGADYPYFLTHHWAQPYRAHRIFDLLSQKPKLTSDDFRRIQGDVYSIGLASFAHDSAKILKPAIPADDQKLRDTLSALENWDGEVKAESAVAPLAFQMRVAFRTRVLTAALGPDLYKLYEWHNSEIILDRLMSEQAKEWLPKEFNSYADLLKACYVDARQALTKAAGPDESKWKWGEVFKIRFNHYLASAPFVGLQFAIAPFPQNGVASLGPTVNVGSSVSMRLIADPSDWDKTQHGITLGESGLPSNSHWKDQLDDWRNVTPRALPFTKAAVDSAAKETLILEPTRP